VTRAVDDLINSLRRYFVRYLISHYA